jgi:hypothetical protein
VTSGVFVPLGYEVERYSPDQPRDEDGRWTDGGGSAPSAPADPASRPVAAPAPAKQDAKAKIDAFEQAKVSLGNFKANKIQAERFVAQWDSRIGESPAEFKRSFLGGVDATMQIDTNADGSWEIKGSILAENGRSIGTYTRTINWRDRSAQSAFLQLTGSRTSKSIGKQILAGNVQTYKKLGLDKVKVHANIDVGGYAWAKYGYVPDRSSWNSLRLDILDKIDGTRSSGSGYRPERWDEISAGEQDRIRDAWLRSTRDEFVQSEIDNWRDNGEALDQAKDQLAHDFDSDQAWALDVVNDVIEQHFKDENPIPYTGTQILNAMRVHYETGYEGRKDPDWAFDDAALRDPSDAPAKEQLTLPGIKPPDLSAHLTTQMRDDLIDKLTEAFEERAQQVSEELDPPDYIYENITDYQHDVWDGMSDRAKYRWADDNGSIEELPSEDDDDGNLDIDDSEATEIRELANSSNPKALWAIADSGKGRELLLGSDWYGTLNLKDQETMARFDAYVGKAKVSAHAVPA